MTSPQATLNDHSENALASDGETTHARKRILVVEDDGLILQLYSDVLMLSGYLVETAKDGAEGWQAIYAANSASAGYDLVITDNSMPKMTGVEMIAMLRSKSLKLPVILATGMAPANTDSLRLSAILIKPFTPVELLRKVEEVLQCAPLCL